MLHAAVPAGCLQWYSGQFAVPWMSSVLLTLPLLLLLLNHLLYTLLPADCPAAAAITCQ